MWFTTLGTGPDPLVPMGDASIVVPSPLTGVVTTSGASVGLTQTLVWGLLKKGVFDSPGQVPGGRRTVVGRSRVPGSLLLRPCRVFSEGSFVEERSDKNERQINMRPESRFSTDVFRCFFGSLT